MRYCYNLLHLGYNLLDQTYNKLVTHLTLLTCYKKPDYVRLSIQGTPRTNRAVLCSTRMTYLCLGRHEAPSATLRYWCLPRRRALVRTQLRVSPGRRWFRWMLAVPDCICSFRASRVGRHRLSHMLLVPRLRMCPAWESFELQLCRLFLCLKLWLPDELRLDRVHGTHCCSASLSSSRT